MTAIYGTDYDEHGYPIDAEIEARLEHNRRVAREADILRVRQEARQLLAAEEAAQTTIPALIRLDEFLARPLPEVTHRIAGLWPVGGRILLAAQWKAGKTTLRDNVIRALVDGHQFLDTHPVDPVTTGTVTLIDNELDERTLQRWLDDQGFHHQHRVHVRPLRGQVATFNILDPTIRTQWADQLRAAHTNVLVLDCLRPFLDAFGLSEDKDAGRFLTALDALAHEAGIDELLLVHHMGHGSERSRGDSRLRDWPDAEWRLVRDKDEDDPTLDNPAGARYFSAFGRDVDHPQRELTYDTTTRHLTLSPDAGTRRDSSQRRQITAALPVVLGVIAEAPGIGKRDLRTAVRARGIGSNPTIDKAIDHLRFTTQQIHVREVGKSHLHYLTDTPKTPHVPDVPDRAPGTEGTVPRAPIGTGTSRTTQHSAHGTDLRHTPQPEETS